MHIVAHLCFAQGRQQRHRRRVRVIYDPSARRLLQFPAYPGGGGARPIEVARHPHFAPRGPIVSCVAIYRPSASVDGVRIHKVVD